MITCVMEPMARGQEEELRKWLRQDALQLLRRVAEGRMKQKQAEFLSEATQSRETDDKMLRANAHLKAAQRFQDFLAVLKEIVDTPTPFEIAKVN